MWQYTIFSAAVFVLILGIGDYISLKTKGIFSSILVLSLLYIIGYQTGLIPTTSPMDTGLVSLAGSFAMLMIVTNMGTMIELKQLLKEWKTVTVCIAGLAIMGLGFMTIGAVVFSREHAMCAFPPVAGAIVAAQMVSEAAAAAGQVELAGFATLLCALQTFVAVPIAAVCLNRFTRGYVKTPGFQDGFSQSRKNAKEFDIRIIKGWPDGFNSANIMAGKLLLATFLGVLTTQLTKGKVPAAVAVLLYGVILTELGFLDRNALQKAGMFNFCMLGLLSTLLPSFSNMSMPQILGLAGPLLFFLLLGALLLGVGGAVCGRLFFHMDIRLAAALSLSAMFGFPCTMIITNDVIRGMQLPAEEAERLTDYVMPKMLIAGFTSVTVCSVVIAGFIVPNIF